MNRGSLAPEDRPISDHPNPSTPLPDPTASTDDDPAVALALALAAAALEKKAQDVVILDLRGLVDFTDIFVLATARNPRQVRAVAESVRLSAKHDHDAHAVGVEGQESGRWVLCDFGDVVVHVFDRDMRGFYDLDGLWRDAPRLEVPDVEVEELPEPFFTLG